MGTQDAPNQTLTQNENDNAFARLDFLFSQIPDHIYDWLFSDQAAVNVTALAKRFSLSEVQTVQLARLTGLVILKDISLSTMTLEFKKSLGLDDTITRQLAISTATTQFLPIRDHLIGVEEFIRQLGGSLPAALPPLLKLSQPAYQNVKRGELAAANTKLPGAPIIQKTLRQLVKDDKDALNQNLTGTPIRITDFDQPVRPTIKNWLVDYVKLKGAGHHESLERSDYLFNSPNTKGLPEEERALVSAILNAYDNDSPLPINAQDNTILLRPVPRGDLPADKEFYAAPLTAPNAPRTDYREPISPEDLSGPLKQPPPTRGAPRLSGNIIDLKDLE